VVDLVVLGLRLDSMILKVLSILNDSMILNCNWCELVPSRSNVLSFNTSLVLN